MIVKDWRIIRLRRSRNDPIEEGPWYIIDSSTAEPEVNWLGELLAGPFVSESTARRALHSMIMHELYHSDSSIYSNLIPKGVTPMTTNYSTAVFLINNKVRCITVSYQPKNPNGEYPPASREYHFKSLDPTLGRGDYVIVPSESRHKMSVVQIVEVGLEPDLDSTVEFKWIIAKIDCTGFKRVAAQEAEAIVIIKAAEKRKRRAQLHKDLVDNTGAEALKALPVWSGPSEAEMPPF